MYTQFLDQGLLHSKLYTSVSCGCNVEGKCVQDAVCTEQEVTAVLLRQWERGGFAEEVMPGQILKHK